jgi:hypothetical protein
VTPRIDRSCAVPSRGSAGWVGRAILFVLRLADGDASAVRGPRASAMPPRREIVGRGANEQRAATVVMAAAPVPPRGVLGGCECVCWTLSPVVYVRMVRCIDKTLIQYVSAGPYNTRSGPQELPRPFRRNSAQAMRLFHKVLLQGCRAMAYRSIPLHYTSYLVSMYVPDHVCSQTMPCV